MVRVKWLWIFKESNMWPLFPFTHHINFGCRSYSHLFVHPSDYPLDPWSPVILDTYRHNSVHRHSVKGSTHRPPRPWPGRTSRGPWAAPAPRGPCGGTSRPSRLSSWAPWPRSSWNGSGRDRASRWCRDNPRSAGTWGRKYSSSRSDRTGQETTLKNVRSSEDDLNPPCNKGQLNWKPWS